VVLIRILLLIYISGSFISASMAQDDSSMPIRITLKDAIQSADTVNFQVMMANARLEQAIARISQAESDLLPHVDGTVSGGRQTADLRSEGLKIPIPGFSTEIGPYNNFDARARVTINLFDPSAFERFQAAKKGEKLSEAQLQKIREDVLALVASLFVEAKRRQETVELMQKLLDRDQMAYDISLNSLNQGTETALNSSKFKSNLDQTKYLYSQAKQQALDATLDLQAAMQLPLDKPLIFVDDNDFLKNLEDKSVIKFDDASNADMVLAASQLEAHRADQKSAYADFLPQISGSANYGRSGESPDHGSNTYFVGLQATIPIWEGGDQQAKLKEVKGEIKEDQENILDAHNQEQVNISKARAAIAEAYDFSKSKTQALQTAQKSLLIAFHSQEIGSGSVLEVMQAKADLAVAEDDYNEAQADWVMAHIDLLHAEGRLRELVKNE